MLFFSRRMQHGPLHHKNSLFWHLHLMKQFWIHTNPPGPEASLFWMNTTSSKCNSSSLGKSRFSDHIKYLNEFHSWSAISILRITKNNNILFISLFCSLQIFRRVSCFDWPAEAPNFKGKKASWVGFPPSFSKFFRSSVSWKSQSHFHPFVLNFLSQMGFVSLLGSVCLPALNFAVSWSHVIKCADRYRQL